MRAWDVAMSIIPDIFFLPAPICPTTRRFRLLGFPEGVRSGPSGCSTLRNSDSFSAHWETSAQRGTMTSVGSRRREMRYAPITVLPNPVGADRIPSSCSSICSAAFSCSSRSSPLNWADMAGPAYFSSCRRKLAPASLRIFRSLRLQPRGRAMNPSRSSPRHITRCFP